MPKCLDLYFNYSSLYISAVLTLYLSLGFIIEKVGKEKCELVS